MDTENLSNILSESLDEVLDRIKLIDYSGAISTPKDLHLAVEVGVKNKEYNDLIQFLTTELKTLLNMDEDVDCVALEDQTAFVMIISSFLRELNCPYEALIGGTLTARLSKYSERLLLVKYLIDQLMLARFLQEKVPEKKLELKLQETPESSDMRKILQTLRFPRPPANITATQLFDKIEATIPLVIKKADGVDLVGDGIFKGSLTDKQWEVLKEVERDLHREFRLRREKLLVRLDVTIQSFQWSDKIKGNEVAFESLYYDQRKILKAEPNVDISDLFAARTELAIHEKISSTSVRRNTKTPLNKIIIGEVPDRGGRCSELKEPEPEMPSWASRSETSAGGFSRGGGRGNYRGGRESRGGRGSGGYEGRGGRGGRGGSSFEGRGGGVFEARGGGEYESQGSGEYEGRGRGGYRNHQPRNSGSIDDNQRGYGGNIYYGSRGGEEGASYDRYGGPGYSGYGNESYNSSRRDSDGSSEDYQQNKRPRTFDNFRTDRTTYAEQYVQENQHNQQYHRGGGRDSYHRGRGSYRGGGYR